MGIVNSEEEEWAAWNLAELREWIDGRIKREVSVIHLRQQTFEDVGDILDSNPNLPPSYFIQFVEENYVAAQAMAVRRQIDGDTRTVNLRRLLDRLEALADAVTLGAFVDDWGNDDSTMAESVFRGRFGGGVGIHLDPAVVTDDRSSLVTVARTVKEHVDKHLAHSDAEPASKLMSRQDVNDAIATVGHIFQKYYGLLSPGDEIALHLIILNHDWREIFTVPWIEADD